jgi:predicted nucleic acid-binding protein
LNLILDASMTLAWQFKRVDPAEILLAARALAELSSYEAIVPALWYSEVANSLLRGERQGAIPAHQTAYFLGELAEFEIVADEILPRTRQSAVLDLARAYGLTVYDATYLELAIRRAATLATFDRQLAEAARAAGVRVFGDAQS